MYIKKDVADSIDNETIIQRFQNKKKIVEGNFKIFIYLSMCVCVCVCYCVMSIYSSFIFTKFCLI